MKIKDVIVIKKSIRLHLMQLESGILFQRSKRFLVPVFFRFRYSSKFNENRVGSQTYAYTRAQKRIYTHIWHRNPTGHVDAFISF